MAKPQQREIKFPIKGLSEAFSFSEQPGGGYSQGEGAYGGTTPKALNVASYDPRTGRRRGSSRGGTTKYCSVPISPVPIVPVSNVTPKPAETAAAEAEARIKAQRIQDIVHVVAVVTVNDGRFTDGDVSVRRQDEAGTNRDIEGDSVTNTGERVVRLLTVVGGNVYAVTKDSSVLVPGSLEERADPLPDLHALSTTAKTIQSAAFGPDVYYCDGESYKRYDTQNGAIVNWGTERAVEGTLIYNRTTESGEDRDAENDDDSARIAGATLICNWGGRIVTAGFKNDSHNWQMSAVDSDVDFNPSPAVLNEKMSVTGSLSPAGLVGDVVSALVPMTGDVLIFGCDNSIWKMSGDPASGGRIDLVSSVTGMARGRAFCLTPDGVLYFIGSRGGIFRLDPQGGGPQRLTATSLDERFTDLNMEENTFRLVWDDRRMGVRIYITATDHAESTHYFYDVRADAWWPFLFANNLHNPLSVHLLDGYDASERCVLLGCQDRFLRKEDVDATSDDGEPIETEVWIGPLSNQMILEFQATLSNESGTVDWSIHTASDLQTALETPPLASGRFIGGRNRSQWPRRHITEGYIRLASNEPWSLERLIASVERGTETRDRI